MECILSGQDAALKTFGHGSRSSQLSGCETIGGLC